MATFDLVFEGGGAKGSAFVGALTELFAAKHDVRRVVGTSAGAITATLLGAGYTPSEMLDAVNEKLPTGPRAGQPVFASFMDPPAAGTFPESVIANSETVRLCEQVFPNNPLLKAIGDTTSHKIVSAMMTVELYRELFGFAECGGFYAGDAFLTWFKTKLQQKGYDPAVTWAQFAADKQRTICDVSIVTTDVTDKQMVVLNARTAPNAPVAESVRMSMSIPFVWHEMEWQPTWGTYLGKPKAGNIFVDGGVLSNFPIALVEGDSPDFPEILGITDNPKAAPTIGLLLDETLEVPGAGTSNTAPPRLRTAARAMRLIDCMMGSSDTQAMNRYQELVCHIPVKGFGTTEFRMDQNRLNLLVNSGRIAMRDHLIQRSQHDQLSKAAAALATKLPPAA